MDVEKFFCKIYCTTNFDFAEFFTRRPTREQKKTQLSCQNFSIENSFL